MEIVYAVGKGVSRTRSVPVTTSLRLAMLLTVYVHVNTGVVKE